MTSKNTSYIDSLIDFILDVKPYHTKLREIVEKYKFEDTINVSIDDSKHFIFAKFSSVWDNTFFSDGSSPDYLLPSFYIRPKNASDHVNYIVQHDSQKFPVNSEIPGINTVNSAYRYETRDGIKILYKNNLALNEGLDYYVSQGAFSFRLSKIDNKYQWIETHYVGTPLESMTRDCSTQSFNVENPLLPDQIWTLIKIHPLAYTRPQLTSSSTGFPIIDPVTGQFSYGLNSYVFGYDSANYDSGGDDLSCGVNAPSDPDDPDNDNFYASGNYYAGELYDSRVQCFDFLNLNFSNVPNAPAEIWTVTAISSSTFSVVGSISGPQANAYLNIPYDNGIISFTISTLNPDFALIPFLDVFVFDVFSEAPHLIFNNKDFYNVRSDTWSIIAVDSEEFIVTSNLGGIDPVRARINVPYNNGQVSFTIYPGAYTFDSGDTFTFSTFENAPTYLVYGSVSGMQLPANPGVPYNNGQISFTLDYPGYFGNVGFVSNDTPNLSLDSNLDYITSTNPSVNSGRLYFVNNTNQFISPRRDAWEEEIIVRAISLTTFDVTSSRRGQLKNATINQTYVDDYFTFTISSGVDPLLVGDTFRFSIKPHSYRLWYANDNIIFGNTVHSADVNIFSVVNSVDDKFRIDDIKYDHFELKVEDNYFPLVEQGDIYYPGRESITSLYSLRNPSQRVGSIENNLLTFDAGFLSLYLTLNTEFTLTQKQQGSYLHKVAARLTDDIKFKEKIYLEDSFSVHFTAEDYFTTITLRLHEIADTVNVNISENRRIRIDTCTREPVYYMGGYDSFNYDNEPEVSGIVPSVPQAGEYDSTMSIEILGPNVEMFGYDEFNYDNEPEETGPSDGPLPGIYDFGLEKLSCKPDVSGKIIVSNTNIVETFMIYSKVPTGSPVFGPNGRALGGFDKIKTLEPTDLFYNHTIINPNPLNPTRMTYVVVDATTVAGWGTEPVKRVILNDVGMNDLNDLQLAPTILITMSLPTTLDPSPPIVEVPTPIAFGSNLAAPYKGFYVDLTGNYTSFVLIITV